MQEGIGIGSKSGPVPAGPAGEGHALFGSLEVVVDVDVPGEGYVQVHDPSLFLPFPVRRAFSAKESPPPRQ